MQKPVITIYRSNNTSKAVKPAQIYVGTHEKLIALREECGLSLPALIDMCVNFTLECAVISDAQVANYTIESEDK